MVVDDACPAPAATTKTTTRPENGETPTAITKERSPSSPYISIFPSRPSSNSLSLISRSTSLNFPPPAVITIELNLKTKLDAATRFAFADLLVTVLKLDFYRPDQPSM